MNLANRPPLGLKPARAKPDPDYLARVRSLPCVIGEHFGEPCDGPTEAHHPICDRYSRERAPDHEAIPLCAWGHHRGPNGIHADKKAWRAKYGSDRDFIAGTRDRLGV